MVFGGGVRSILLVLAASLPLGALPDGLLEDFHIVRGLYEASRGQLEITCGGSRVKKKLRGRGTERAFRYSDSAKCLLTDGNGKGIRANGHPTNAMFGSEKVHSFDPS